MLSRILSTSLSGVKCINEAENAKNFHFVSTKKIILTEKHFYSLLLRHSTRKGIMAKKGPNLARYGT